MVRAGEICPRRRGREFELSFDAWVLFAPVLVRESRCAARALLGFSQGLAHHSDASRPRFRGEQVGHAPAPRHLLGVGRVELPEACQVNAEERNHGDGCGYLVGPIKAVPSGEARAALGSTGWIYAARGERHGANVEGAGRRTCDRLPKNSCCSSLTSGRGRRSARSRGWRR